MLELIKPIEPDRELLTKYLDLILDSGFYTNNGPFAKELEKKISEFLDCKGFLLTSNGTVSLEIAIKMFQDSSNGNIVTTPYSYVATANAADWIGLQVRFADLAKDSLFPDPNKVEEMIDSDTQAIVITHVYGLCGPLEAYQEIADRKGVPLIYDAAHAFGVKYRNRSVTDFGMLSSFSFHATKTFNTVEGGGLAINNPDYFETAFNLRSFGHRGDDYLDRGINGKLSEVHAAFGLAQLSELESNKTKREKVFNTYLKELTFKSFSPVKIDRDLDWNYAYFPLFFEENSGMEAVRKNLLNHDIMARRYFYPSLNTLAHLRSNDLCPVSESLASRCLCIPFHPKLEENDQSRVIEIINSSL